MAGLSILGGIGDGLMRGSTFVQNKRQQDARLGMLEEEHQWKQQDRQTAQQEAQRKAEFDEIYSGVWNELGADADPLKVSSEAFKRSVATGKARREELEPFVRDVGVLRQRGITNAIRMGDGNALAQAFSQQFGQPVQVQTQMTKDHFGHPVPVFSIVGQNGNVLQQLDALMVGSILGADDILRDEELKMKRATGLSALAKDQASIRSSNASAANSYASAAGRNQDNARERAVWEAQQAVAAGTATAQQRALVQQQSRSTAGGSDPADVRIADWLISNGVADTPATAWEMVRTARAKSPEDAIAGLVSKMQGDPMNIGVSAEELVERASAIYRAIAQRGDAAPAPSTPRGDDADPLGLFR